MFEEFITGIFGGEKREDTVRMKGEISYYVDTVIKGVPPYHTCSIVLSCFEDSKKAESIDFEVKWYKVIGNEVYMIKDYNEKYYHVNASDVDVVIKAGITSKESHHSGVATFLFGPVALDPILKPEIEGMLYNADSYFSVNLMKNDDIKVLPNICSLKIHKPYFSIEFDQHLSIREKNPSKWDKVKLNIEKDNDLKMKADSSNINNVIIIYNENNSSLDDIFNDAPDDQEDKKLRTLTFKFDSRMQRDIFYIYFKLMRILRSKILVDIKNEYDSLINVPWLFINKYQNTRSSDSYNAYENNLSYDLVREELKSMIRLNKELNEENITMIDTVDILEADLDLAAHEFRRLIEDSKGGNRKNLKNYEKSGISILQESSMVVDDLRNKTKKNKKDIEKSIIEDIRYTKEDIESIKKENDMLMREIDKYKNAPSKGGKNNPMDSLQVSAIMV